MASQELPSRATHDGIAQRSLINLEFVRDPASTSHERHVVTQIYLSSLGVLLHPWEERFRFDEAVNLIQHSGLQVRPGSNPSGSTLKHLRNAIAHGRVRFLSDSLDPADVDLELEDGFPVRDATETFSANWWATINAADLEVLVKRLAKLVPPPGQQV